MPTLFQRSYIGHLNAGVDQIGGTMQNCYVVTLLEIVRHLEGGHGEHCGPCMARYCNAPTFQFC
jgi:hypothetical protein